MKTVLFICLGIFVCCLEGQRRGQKPSLTYLTPTRAPTTITTTKTTTTTSPPETDSSKKAVPQVHGHDDSSDPLDWLRASIPGEPGVDYPIYSSAPETSFVCDPNFPGYFSDPEAGCQVWRQCYEDRMWSGICPNGTIFNQEVLNCVWWFDFDCNSAIDFRFVNERLYPDRGEAGLLRPPTPEFLRSPPAGFVPATGVPSIPLTV